MLQSIGLQRVGHTEELKGTALTSLKKRKEKKQGVSWETMVQSKRY